MDVAHIRIRMPNGKPSALILASADVNNSAFATSLVPSEQTAAISTKTFDQFYSCQVLNLANGRGAQNFDSHRDDRSRCNPNTKPLAPRFTPLYETSRET